MIEHMLKRLEKVSKSGKGYIARCPAHDDKTPSLALQECSDGRILLKCFAGCSALEVVGSIGMSMSDLFPDGGLGEYRSFQKIEQKVKSNSRQKNGIHVEESILNMADSDRASGKRLSQQDLAREKLAFERVRRANTNG